jgi:hypothetical protein
MAESPAAAGLSRFAGTAIPSGTADDPALVRVQGSGALIDIGRENGMLVAADFSWPDHPTGGGSLVASSVPPPTGLSISTPASCGSRLSGAAHAATRAGLPGLVRGAPRSAAGERGLGMRWAPLTEKTASARIQT